MIETIQITSDAYYFIKYDEEPLDPDNIEEAEELIDMFKPRFDFIGEPEPVDGTDMVEVKISIAERKKLAESCVVDFIILPDKQVHVTVSNLRPNSNFEARDQIQDLEPIGDAYWAEYAYSESSKTRSLLPVCKIVDYENQFRKS